MVYTKPMMVVEVVEDDVITTSGLTGGTVGGGDSFTEGELDQL